MAMTHYPRNILFHGWCWQFFPVSVMSVLFVHLNIRWHGKFPPYVVLPLIRVLLYKYVRRYGQEFWEYFFFCTGCIFQISDVLSILYRTSDGGSCSRSSSAFVIIIIFFEFIEILSFIIFHNKCFIVCIVKYQSQYWDTCTSL